MSTRRELLKTAIATAASCALPLRLARAQAVLPPAYKAQFAARLKRLLAAGALPYIDLESSCNARKVDIKAIARQLDELNIGLMALSSDIGEGQLEKGVRFDDFSAELSAAFPDRFIPVGNGGGGASLTDVPLELLDAQEQAANAGKFLLFGEYEFRHYASPRQAKRGDFDRDVTVPIDGPVGHRLFSLAEKTGLPFQIHYEIEDALLPPLEKMLSAYPRARVVWCHVAQIRDIEHARSYSPEYVDGLLKRFPQLHFDTAFGDYQSVYKPTGQRQSRIWAADDKLQPAWLDLIVAHPDRFLSALDIGQDRIDRLAEYDGRHRHFLSRLPETTRHQVAYRATWKLLFGEEFA